MEESTVFLWAGGSLADDGSTVSKQVILYSSVWMMVHILNRAGSVTVRRSDIEDLSKSVASV